VETLIVIDAPIERVWEVLADVPGQPRWMRDMKAVRILTPGPIAEGTRSEGTIRILGITVTDPVEITTWEPPQRFAVRHEGLFEGSGQIALQAGAEGTTTIVRWSEVLVPPVLPWLWSELNRPVFRHVFQTDLENLRDLVESGGAARSER
jgi:uncharacterized membrane protein